MNLIETEILPPEVEPTPPPSADEARTLDVSFRPRNPSDLSDDEKFINAGFLRGFKASPYTYGLSADTYFSVARQAWKGIQRDMVTTVAHAKGKPDEMMGFVTYRKDSRGVLGVAWLHVSKDWRRLGVGTALLEHAGARPRGQEIAALFGNPEAIDKFRRKGFSIRLAPFACWQWLGAETMGEVEAK